jgi:outer membrane protein TolC
MRFVLGWLLIPVVGCFTLSRTSSQALLEGSTGPAGCLDVPPAGIYDPIAPPSLPPPPAPADDLPAPPTPAAPPPSTATQDGEEKTPVLPPPREVPPAGTLDLAEVLQSVDQHFPLLLAARQERDIAFGQRIAAEGAFDLNLRTRGTTQSGTFPNNRLDAYLEQPTPLYGVNFFGGYRFGFGDFPVYYGDRQTADGGEFRGGVVVPLLRDGPIDKRRATLRQAQIGEALTDPLVQRARIDHFRAAARAYWNWVGAGAQYQVTEALLRLARDRQAGLEEQFKRGQIAEFVVIDNRRLIVEREGALIAAERRLQQAAFELSLYLRDPEGNPVVPQACQLPASFAEREPTPPGAEQLRADVETAYNLRPELVRFELLKERTAVDLGLAENQAYPTLNAVISGAQDVGKGKKSSDIFALDRSVFEASLLLEVPLQRREARGRIEEARAKMMQLLAEERFARDRITTEVQDAVSNLDRTYQRLGRAREEQRIANRVAELELERFRKGQGTLLEVNLRELASAGAQAKVVEALADYFRALADYRAALGLDGKPGGHH